LTRQNRGGADGFRARQRGLARTRRGAPASGKVLEGESRGNEINFITSANLGAYYYVRFYLLSGDDVSEEERSRQASL
jgi:hypothetical protein